METRVTSQAIVFQIYLDLGGKTTDCSLKTKIYGKCYVLYPKWFTSI